MTDEDYEPFDDPNLLNPERGVYYWEPRPDDPHTLVAQWLYLGAHCAKDLVWRGHHSAGTSPLLDDYATKLAAHREAGRKIVFRPRYDTPESDGLNACKLFQADSEKRMRGHVDAVAAMLGDFRDVVAFVEAGYLGRWGEWNWHDYKAKNAPVLADSARRRAFLAYVIDAYRAAGLRRYIGVRRPLFSKEMADAYPKQAAFLGHHNDCFMTNATDQGTYDNFEEDNPSNFPSAEAAVDWLRVASLESPFGGETCGTPADKPRWLSCENIAGAKSEPAALHMSYLHAGYAEDAKATWEKGGCYGEIKSRLGYRFEILSVGYPKQSPASAPVTVSVRLRNTGWARMHNPRRAYVILSGAGVAYTVGGSLPGCQSLPAVQTSGENMRDWLPGKEAVFAQTFAPPSGTWEVGIMLPDPDRPDLKKYAVSFASARKGQPGKPLYDQLSGVNALGIKLDILQAP